MRAGLAAAAAAAALNAAFQGFPTPAFPPAAAVSLAGDGVVASVALWSLGMRRLAADLGYVRLLVYYGSDEDDSGSMEEMFEEGHHHAGGMNFGFGRYEEVLPRARRILAVDPYWSYPVMYAASALAFNLQRPQEALDLLAEALVFRPGDRQFLSTVAAVGFHKNGDLSQALDRLMPAVDGPDSPTMLKNMAAYMNERAGRRGTAVRLYREILDSRDASYHDNARRGLQRLAAGPD